MKRCAKQGSRHVLKQTQQAAVNAGSEPAKNWRSSSTLWTICLPQSPWIKQTPKKKKSYIEQTLPNSPYCSLFFNPLLKEK